jgi:hypothetical protein
MICSGCLLSHRSVGDSGRRSAPHRQYGCIRLQLWDNALCIREEVCNRPPDPDLVRTTRISRPAESGGVGGVRCRRNPGQPVAVPSLSYFLMTAASLRDVERPCRRRKRAAVYISSPIFSRLRWEYGGLGVGLFLYIR